MKAIASFRQRWPDDGPKVIATTARALEDDEEKCVETGLDANPQAIKLDDLKAALEQRQKIRGFKVNSVG